MTQNEENIERRVEVAGEVETVQIAPVDCDYCGENAEVPVDQVGSERLTFCSIGCSEQYYEGHETS